MCDVQLDAGEIHSVAMEIHAVYVCMPVCVLWRSLIAVLAYNYM